MVLGPTGMPGVVAKRPVPYAVTAATWKMYETPFVKGVTVYDVTVEPVLRVTGSQVTPLSVDRLMA